MSSYEYNYDDDSSVDRSLIPTTLHDNGTAEDSGRHTRKGNDCFYSNKKEDNGDIAANFLANATANRAFVEVIPATSHKSLQKSYRTTSPKTPNSECQSHSP